VFWKSDDEVRDYLASYVASHPGLDPAAINVCNFILVSDLYARYVPARRRSALGHPWPAPLSRPRI